MVSYSHRLTGKKRVESSFDLCVHIWFQPICTVAKTCVHAVCISYLSFNSRDCEVSTPTGQNREKKMDNESLEALRGELFPRKGFYQEKQEVRGRGS